MSPSRALVVVVDGAGLLQVLLLLLLQAVLQVGTTRCFQAPWIRQPGRLMAVARSAMLQVSLLRFSLTGGAAVGSGRGALQYRTFFLTQADLPSLLLLQVLKPVQALHLPSTLGGLDLTASQVARANAKFSLASLWNFDSEAVSLALDHGRRAAALVLASRELPSPSTTCTSRRRSCRASPA